MLAPHLPSTWRGVHAPATVPVLKCLNTLLEVGPWALLLDRALGGQGAARDTSSPQWSKLKLLGHKKEAQSGVLGLSL